MDRRREVINKNVELKSNKKGSRDIEVTMSQGINFATLSNGSSSTVLNLYRPGEDVPFFKLRPGQRVGVSNLNNLPSIANQSIAIVGAGLAGSTAALRLAQKGVFCDVFEANPDRLGGRVWSGWFENSYHGGPVYQSQKYERGGEFIDTGHVELRQLAQELGLTLIDVYQAELKGTQPLYSVVDPRGNQVNYSEKDVIEDYKQVWKQVQADYSAAGFPTLYYSSTERGRQLANTPLRDYINEICKDLPNNYLNQILQVAYACEFGLDTSVQSSLNMIYLAGTTGPGKIRLFGKNSEKYTVAEGNDQVVIKAIAEATRLGMRPVNMGHRLEKLVRRPDKKYELTFNVSGSTKTLVYDRVIMAVPVYTMRPDTLVDPNALDNGNTEGGFDNKFTWHINVSQAQFSLKKRQAIVGLGPAESSKLMIQFNNRFWSVNNCNGDIFATRIVNGKETQLQSTWDTSRGQTGNMGILTNFTGGTYSIDNTYTSGVDSSEKIEEQVNKFVRQLEEVLPGAESNISRGQDGIILNNYYAKNWKDEQYARGAYTSYYIGNEAGQTSSFVGTEPLAEPQDEPNYLLRNCHFCGEYTSFEYLGFMNGAVSSGNRVADEVYSVLRNLAK